MRNLRVNPQVSLHLNSDETGNQIATFEGSARPCDDDPPAQEVPAYLAKYRSEMPGFDMTPEQLGAEYRTALRITRPACVSTDQVAEMTPAGCRRDLGGKEAVKVAAAGASGLVGHDGAGAPGSR